MESLRVWGLGVQVPSGRTTDYLVALSLPLSPPPWLCSGHDSDETPSIHRVPKIFWARNVTCNYTAEEFSRNRES